MDASTDEELAGLRASQQSIKDDLNEAPPAIIKRVTSVYNIEKWGCFQWTLITLSFILPTYFIIAVYACCILANKGVADVSVSAIIGNPNALPLSIPTFLIVCIGIGWTTFIRNVQIRVIYDRLDCFNLSKKDDPDTKQLTDYVCSCCSGCGGPIYHNKVNDHNRVNSCKYYFITLRGFNFLTTITNIIGWILFACVSLVPVQYDSSKHFQVVFAALIPIHFYQFTHSVVLTRQRMVEYELCGREKWFDHFWDCMYVWTMSTASLICIIIYVLGYIVPELEPYKYQFEWAWFTLAVAYFYIYIYLFCYDNVLEEMREYSHFARHWFLF